ncbi:MAG: phospholipid carrier-dependent glycosyltransferase [bacterium]
MKKIDKNIIFIIFAFLVTRLPLLGKDIINVDAPAWNYRATQFYAYLKNFNFVETYRIYHPGVTLMWISGFGIEVYNQIYKLFFGIRAPYYEYNLFPYLHFSQKFPLVVVDLGLVLLCYKLLKNLVDKRVALLFIAFFMLEPFVVANTRVLHLDGLMLLFMMSSILFILDYLINKKRWVYLMLSSVFASFAILTKVSAAFVILFNILLLFVFRFIGSKSVKEFIKKLFIENAIFIFGIMITALIIFPAMWVSPIEVVRKIIMDGVIGTGQGGQPQTFLGKGGNNPGMLFYIYTLAFRLSPLVLVGIPVSFFILLRNFIKKPRVFVKENKVVLIFILFGLLYFIQMALSSKKIDRYILPSIMSLCLFVSFGIYPLVKKHIRIVLAVLAIQFVLLSYQIFPDYFNYANPLFGGLRGSLEVFGPMEWGAGYYKVADFLNNYAHTTENSYLAAFNNESIKPYFKGRVEQIDQADFSKMQYIILPPSDDYRLEIIQIPSVKLIKTIKYGSVDYWYIYENENPVNY